MTELPNNDASVLGKIFFAVLSIPIFFLSILVIFFGCKTFVDAIIWLPRSIVHFKQGNVAGLGSTSGGFLAGPLVVYLGTRLWKLARRTATKSLATDIPQKD